MRKSLPCLSHYLLFSRIFILQNTYDVLPKSINMILGKNNFFWWWRTYYLFWYLMNLYPALRWDFFSNWWSMSSIWSLDNVLFFLNWFMTFLSFVYLRITMVRCLFTFCLHLIFYVYVFLTRLATGLNEENPKEGRRTKTQQLRCGALLLNRYHLRFEFQLSHSNLINIKLMHVLMNWLMRCWGGILPGMPRIHTLCFMNNVYKQRFLRFIKFLKKLSNKTM